MARLGVHTFAFAPTWEPARLDRPLGALREHGVRVVEVPLLRPEEIDIPSSRDLAKSHGLDLVCSLGLPDRLDVTTDPEAGLAFLKPAFKVTAELGCEMLGGVTYTTIGRTTGRAPTQAELDGTWRFLEKAARLAADFDLKLGIEPCNRYETHLLNTAAQAADWCERIGAANLVIHLDTYHMHIEEQDHREAFAVAAPYLGYLHVSESHRGTPGTGQVNWSQVMEGLVAIDFDQVATLESMNHVDADIAGALAIWRAVAEDPAMVVEQGLPFLREQARIAGLRLGDQV